MRTDSIDAECMCTSADHNSCAGSTTVVSSPGVDLNAKCALTYTDLTGSEEVAVE